MPTSTTNRPRRRRVRSTVVLAGGAAALLALTSACGSGNSSTGGGKAKPKLAFIYATTTQNPFQEMAYGAKAAAKDEGADLTASAPTGVNGPAQVPMFQSALRTSTDGVGLETLTPDLFVRPVQQGTDQGVPMVAVDTPPPAGTKIGLFVGNSNTEVGKQLGQELVKRLPADAHGDVVIGDDIPGLSVLDQRIAGMKEVIKAQRPNVNILGPFDSKSEPTDNYNAWVSIVAAHPNALAYIGPGAQDAVSLSTIEKKTGKKFLVGACDLDPTALQGVKDGLVFAMVSPEHWMKGYVAIAALAEHAKTGKALPTGWWNTGQLTVDTTNIDQIIARQKDEASRAAWFANAAKQQISDPQAHLAPLSAAN